MSTPEQDRIELSDLASAFSVEEVTRLANEMFQSVSASPTSPEGAAADVGASSVAVEDATEVSGTPETIVATDSTDDLPEVTSLGWDTSPELFVINDEQLDAVLQAVQVDESSAIPIGFDTSLVNDWSAIEEANTETAESQSGDVVDAETVAVVDESTLEVAPTSSGDFDHLAEQLVAELPDADRLSSSLSNRPETVTEAAEYAVGDHPYLESKYDKAVAQGGVSDVPAGSEFTGQQEHLAEVPGLAEALATTDDVLGGEQVANEAVAEVVGDVGIADSAEADEADDNHHKQQHRDDFSPELVPSLPQKKEEFNVERIRADFPILRERVNGHRLVWLDNGATTQKPQSVIDRISYFYEHENSNVHRTAHTLAGRSTDAYEGARDKIRKFINASTSDEIVYVRGTTEGINLIANTFGEQRVCEGDEILISNLEHHANIVPWQMLAARNGAKIRVAPVDDTGQIILSEFERLITPRTKLISFTQVSNALGTITPAAEMIEIAHRHDVPVVLDGAQGVLHMRVDVQKLNPDFYVFSGHKMFGPTGIGVVYGKYEHLEKMPPWQGGGNMIDCVYFDRTTYQAPPWRFEAGTGNIADAVGLGTAIDYINDVGIENIAAHEHELLRYGTEGLNSIPGLRIIGTAANKAAVMSFTLEGFSTEQVASYLDRQGIAVRAGHHCAQPILRRFGVTETVRPSLALYNTHDDIDRLVTALRRLKEGGEGS